MLRTVITKIECAGHAIAQSRGRSNWQEYLASARVDATVLGEPSIEELVRYAMPRLRHKRRIRENGYHS